MSFRIWFTLEENLSWQELLGFVGGFFTTFSLVPQVWRLYRIKSAKEISLAFNVFFALGVIFWLAYGILLDLPAVILWNSITLVLVSSMLYAKIKYNK
jgi:MtN3 and saliva related transmembrane protein